MGLDVAEIGMGADLSLDLRHFASKAVRQARDAPASSELDAFIRQLEEEQCKIVAFRSELPLCVRIVAYATGAMKEEKRKSDGEEEEDGAAADKSKWMSTAQLWTGGSDRESEKQADKLQGRNALRSKSCGGGGAFVPFKAVGSGAPAFGPPLYTRKDDNKQPPPADAAVPDLSLLTPPAIQSGVADESRRHVVGFAQAAARAAAMAPAAAPALSLQPQQSQPQAAQQQQQPRKSRRCWSTELHRQFVAALNQLGGPHAATPKQIRELMKVDGLTNDEVKSHLQKYRLHNRRTPGSAVVNHQPIMVVGGLWIPHHQQEPSSSSHQSGSPHGPLHLSTASGIVAASSSAATASAGEEEDGSCRSADSYGWV